MICIEHVTYYTVEEILQRSDNVLSEDEIRAFLVANPSYGLLIGGQWHSYDLAIGFMNRPDSFRQSFFLAGAQGFDFTDLHFSGRVLDIGAGGEGIIGQVAGEQAVGIALEEHSKELASAPGCGLKICMDARYMKFLDHSFESVTAFFTLMYIDNADHERVFKEVYRVLKPGGEFFLWDMVIPQNTTPEKKGYLLGIEVQLKDKKVLSGYGAKWVEKEQDTAYFKNIALNSGFTVLKGTQNKHLVYLKLTK